MEGVVCTATVHTDTPYYGHAIRWTGDDYCQNLSGLAAVYTYVTSCRITMKLPGLRFERLFHDFQAVIGNTIYSSLSTS